MDKLTYLTLDRYLARANDLGVGHWKDARKRWTYHAAAVAFSQIARPSSPARVLEMGTMGVQIVEGSDTIDYSESWNFEGKNPTYNHDARNIPWPIADKHYDLFIALRVFHHLAPSQEAAFKEAKRIARNVIISAPESYDKIPGSKGILVDEFVEWNKGVPPTAVMHIGPGLGNVYFWSAEDLADS